MDCVKKVGAFKILRKINMHGHFGAILNTSQKEVAFLILGEQKLILAISTDENNPITFSKPAPEASPVLPLGKFSKGQVRTKQMGVTLIC